MRAGLIVKWSGTALLAAAIAWGGCGPRAVGRSLGPCKALLLKPVAGTRARVTPRKAKRPPPVTLIRSSIVWTAAGKILEKTDVLLKDGKIAAVGKGLTAPAGAVTVDGTGKHLTPGMIDPHSHIGVFPVPHLKAHSDGNEVGKPVFPAARASDAFWPQTPSISRALAAGVTTVQVLPGSANLIGGYSFTVKLVPGASAEQMRFPGAPFGMKMACGENPKMTYRKKGGPFTRMGSVARVRTAFQKALEYRRKWKRYRAQLKKWRGRRAKACRPGARGRRARKDREALPPDPPNRDFSMEALMGVLDGKIRVHWHCYRADEMLLMMRLARRFGFRVAAFHHALEAYKIRRALRRSGTGTVTFLNWWGYKVEAYDGIPENAPMLVADGALATLHSDSPQVIQRFNQEAALAYFRGRDMGLNISRDDAIKLVTLNSAKVLGIDKFTGSIEKGKMADLVLWDGDPFSVYTRTERVFVDGRQVYHRRSPTGRRPSDFELGTVPRPEPLQKAGRKRAARPVRPVRAAGRVARGSGPAVAITGARIHTMTGGAPYSGTVLIRGERIAAVGPKVAVPKGAVVVDARGMVVTPGLIAADTALGLVEISLEPTARDISSGKYKDPVRAALRIWDALNPASAAIPVNRIEGFTTAVIRPFGGLVNGQGAAFDLHGSTRKQMRLKAPVAMHAALGLSGARVAGGNRALALMRLRKLLADTRRYKKARAAVEARRYRKLSASVEDLAALIPVVDRKIPLVVKVHRAADILTVLRLARREKIVVVLNGAAEGWRVAKAIARAKVPVLVEGDLNLPANFEMLGGRFDNAARLHRAGVKVAFAGSGRAHNVRFLRQVAGIAVAWGLPHRAAMAALTSVPAEVFGLRDRGVLRPGALANVVVWNGDPLELKTRVKRLFIGGKSIPLTSRQTALRERYRKLGATQ